MSSTMAKNIAPTRQSWWRDWRKAIPAGLVGLLLIGGLSVGGYVLIRAQRVKQHALYEQALATVQESKSVAERLGAPIVDASWNPNGQINESGDRGDGRINFEVAGPKGGAKVFVQGRKIDGEWGINQLYVQFADEERVSLMPEVRLRQEDTTPKFDPNQKTEAKSGADVETPTDVNIGDDIPELPGDLK